MGRMAFVIHRLVLLVPTVLGVTIITFFMIHLIPGDPAQTILGIHATPRAIAILHAQCVEPNLEHGYYSRQRGQYDPGRVQTRVFLKAPNGPYHRDGRHRNDEEVKQRIESGVILERLRNFFAHETSGSVL